jgi:ATP-dependent RNA helicase DDX55/SPB4
LSIYSLLFLDEYVHRFASLDLGTLATSFCLLRLPKMPELRDILQKHKGKLPTFTSAGREIDIFAIPYTDKAREQARQKRLQEELASGGKNAKRIEAERRKEEKERKDEERRQKAVEKGRNPDKKRGRQAQLIDEWEDLAKEERLVKKLRRGKMTKEEFNEQMNDV